MKILLVLVSIVLIGCGGNEKQNTELEKTSTKKVLIDELTNKGTKESPLMYYESKLFNGIGFDLYSNGNPKEEINYKDGKKDGLYKEWNENGRLYNEKKYNSGNHRLVYSIFYSYHENGQILSKRVFNDLTEGIEGLGNHYHHKYIYYENGQLKLKTDCCISCVEFENSCKGKIYYENGQLKSEIDFVLGSEKQWVTCWDKNGDEIECEFPLF